MQTNGKSEGYNKGASKSGKEKTDGSPHLSNVFTREESSKHGGYHYGNQQGKHLRETEHYRMHYKDSDNDYDND